MSAPAVAVSADGKKFAVAWKDVREGEPNVYWTISKASVFGQESLVHENTDGIQDHPSLSIGDSGIVWVTWEDNQQVWVRSSLDSDRGVSVSDGQDSQASYPVVACGKQFVAVVYESAPDKSRKEIRFRLVNSSLN